MSKSTTVEEGKTNAIISHLTIIGTLIAFFLNNNTKNPFASFYIRQMLGLYLLSAINGWIVYRFLGNAAGWAINVILFVFWIISFVGAIKGEKKLIPVLGENFQDWFKSL